jgi:hypothetical protein
MRWQDTEGDIASLLGALRYRLNPRLAAAGVQLACAVESLPEIAGWTLQKSRDLQLILFEAFSNLMTHAGATDEHSRHIEKEVKPLRPGGGCRFAQQFVSLLR